MAQILIWSGAISLVLVIILGGPLAGYVISQQRSAGTTRFLATLEHKEIVPFVRGGDLMENTGVIDMPEIGESLFAEQYFAEDPLFSHSLPRDLDMRLPIADETFTALAAEAKLTGAGVDIDAEWREWGMLLKEECLVPA